MILVLIGTKAQLIKMAPVIVALGERGLSYDLVLTGQHHETIDDLLSDLNFPDPTAYLVNPSETDTKGKVVRWLSNALLRGLTDRRFQAQYELCLVHGDTLSTLIGALIGRRWRIPVAHIEAGLRSFKILDPFPEEICRILVTLLSDYFFCQDTTSADNVRRVRPKLSSGNIINTNANTLYDAARLAIQHRQPRHAPPNNYVVFSIHRFENISSRRRLAFIFRLVTDISSSHQVIFVLHPATRRALETFTLTDDFAKYATLRERFIYPDFIRLIHGAEFLVTDGGSNQEEASYLGIPTLIMRSSTERNEGLLKNAILADFDRKTIDSFVANYSNYRHPIDFSTNVRPSQLICDWIADYCSTKASRSLLRRSLEP